MWVELNREDLPARALGRKLVAGGLAPLGFLGGVGCEERTLMQPSRAFRV
jgi:hypothetical protein